MRWLPWVLGEREGKKGSELSSGDGKDNMTTVPSLPLSDIYPKHIKQIKKRKATMSSGLRTLSAASVACSRVAVSSPALEAVAVIDEHVCLKNF